jgi:hypothetical protein
MERARRNTYAWILALGVVLSGCARVTETGMVVFASTLHSFAVVNGQMMTGEVQLVPDRTGSVTLRTSTPSASAALDSFSPISSCMGRLRFTSTSGGEMDLRCNEGSIATLHFSLIADATGYAYNQGPGMPVSLTFGLRAASAKAYLQAPVGKQVVETTNGVDLEIR